MIVFKFKENLYSSVSRHKVRLVAKGYIILDFSPVIKQPAIRVALCMVLQYGWTILNNNLCQMLFDMGE